MAYRSKQFENVNSQYYIAKAKYFQNKFEQISRQKQMIEEKKLEIQQKLEEKKRNEREESLKQLQDNKQKDADLGKKIFRSCHSSHQSWIGTPQREEEKLPSAKPTNIFSNDGSFLDHFRKLTDTNDRDVLKTERRRSSPTRDHSRSPPKIVTPQQMPPMMYPQPPFGMPPMLIQPQISAIMNYHQTPFLFMTIPPPPLPPNLQPLPTISTEQSEDTEVVSSVTPEPPFKEVEINEATTLDEEESLKNDLQDADYGAGAYPHAAAANGYPVQDNGNYFTDKYGPQS